jgi:hypothetical protein
VFDDGRAVYPSSMEDVWLCDEVGETEAFVMRRVEPEEGLSGWIFCCDREDHDHEEPASLRRMSLFDVAVGYEPRSIPYLALPPGAVVDIGPRGPRIRVDGEPVAFRPHSLLHNHFGGGV